MPQTILTADSNPDQTLPPAGQDRDLARFKAFTTWMHQAPLDELQDALASIKSPPPGYAEGQNIPTPKAKMTRDAVMDEFMKVFKDPDRASELRINKMLADRRLYMDIAMPARSAIQRLGMRNGSI